MKRILIIIIFFSYGYTQTSEWKTEKGKDEFTDSTYYMFSLTTQENDDATFVARAACELARDRNVATIAAFTVSGKTAMKLSKARPDVPILAFTPLEKTYQKINLYWGVSPELIKHALSLEEMIEIVENSLINKHNLHAGQQVVLVCGFPISASGPTNLALLHTLRSRNY